jgi:putative transposase
MRPRVPRTIAVNRTVTGPNQLWETDLKYGVVAGEDRFFYLCSVLDVYDRSVLAYHLGWTCTAREALAALQAAVRSRAADFGTEPPVIWTDNGPQFTSWVWAAGCAPLRVRHERIPPATPNKNAHIEAWHSLLERECLGNQVFDTYATAYAAVTTWIAFYNERRYHGSLQDWLPAVFYQRALRGELTIRAVRA